MSDQGRAGPGDLTAADVRHVAELAALELTEAELERLAGELASVLELVATLESAGADEEAEESVPGVSSTAGPTHGVAPGARACGAVEPDPLERSPGEGSLGWREGFFVVPRLPIPRGPDGKAEEGP